MDKSIAPISALQSSLARISDARTRLTQIATNANQPVSLSSGTTPRPTATTAITEQVTDMIDHFAVQVKGQIEAATLRVRDLEQSLLCGSSATPNEQIIDVQSRVIPPSDAPSPS